MPTLTTAEIAALTNATLRGDGAVCISGLNTLTHAVEGDLSFVANARYAKQWAESSASAVLVSKGIELPEDERPVLTVDNADLAMAILLEAFAPDEISLPAGIDSRAVIDDTAQIDPSAQIGPFCHIGPNVVIGAGCVLHGSVTVMQDCQLGEGCVVYPQVVIYPRSIIGRQVILHASCTVGSDGFGYRPGPAGAVKIPHIGYVEIGDGCELGAGSRVDRGKFGSTKIGTGCKLDNQVHIAHNCELGRCVLIAASVAVGGSTIIEDGVQIGGGTAIADHLTIHAGARLGGASGLIQDLPAGEDWMGMPAKPIRDFLRLDVAARRLPDALKQLRCLLSKESS